MPRLACALALLAALASGWAPGSARAAAPLLLGTTEWPAAPEDEVPQWRAVLREIAQEETVVRSCSHDEAACASGPLRDWLGFLRGLEGRSTLEQVRAVNRFVNRWRYRSDTENYGRSDRWATPLQFFERAGDCEDYAIAKYESLRRLGFPPERLRLVVLHDKARDLAHAVLAVYHGNGVLILDNLAEEVLPQERVTNYVPYYSLNATAHWVHGGSGPGRAAAGGAARGAGTLLGGDRSAKRPDGH